MPDDVHHAGRPCIPADVSDATPTLPGDDPELDQPAFPGGLSRRDIGAAREFWQAQVHARGGMAFDELDGFLTLLGVLAHPPPPEVWSARALGAELSAARPDEREMATAWLFRLGTHVAQRVRLDPARHQASVLPEFDILPHDEHESDEDAERRTAKSWSAGAAAAMELDPEGAADIIGDETRRGDLAAIVLLGRDAPEDGPPFTRRQRLRLMREATFGAHRLWRHYQPIRERGGLRTPARAPRLPGRNDPCPCGSGRKFKVCHGAAVH